MIGSFLVAEYGDDGWEHEETNYQKPEWKLVESCIRRLDRFHFPYVWLLKDGDVEGDQLTIMGGNGKYHVWLCDKDGEFLIRNAKKASEIICVWESDQGFETYDNELLDDIEEVLIIAKYYYETGKRHSNFHWTDT